MTLRTPYLLGTTRHFAVYVDDPQTSPARPALPMSAPRDVERGSTTSAQGKR